MAMSVSTSAARTQLAADFVTAWGAKAIYFDTPKTPLTDSAFSGVSDAVTAARVVCLVSDPEPSQQSFSKKVINFRFTITGMFLFPTSGTLQEAKETNADALLALLTASTRYASGGREILAVRFNEIAETEQMRSYFEVVIEFVWTVTVDR